MTGQDGQSAANPSLQTAALPNSGLRPLARVGWVLPALHPSYMFRLFFELFQGVGRDRPSGSHRGRVAGSTRIMSFAST